MQGAVPRADGAQVDKPQPRAPGPAFSPRALQPCPSVARLSTFVLLAPSTWHLRIYYPFVKQCFLHFLLSGTLVFPEEVTPLRTSSEGGPCFRLQLSSGLGLESSCLWSSPQCTRAQQPFPAQHCLLPQRLRPWRFPSLGPLGWDLPCRAGLGGSLCVDSCLCHEV